MDGGGHTAFVFQNSMVFRRSERDEVFGMHSRIFTASLLVVFLAAMAPLSAADEPTTRTWDLTGPLPDGWSNQERTTSRTSS